jgi:hypothetical protein
MFNPKWILQGMVHPVSSIQTIPEKPIIMDIFLLVELESKPTTFYYHTLKYHNT